jgi:PadR family transcriptional regulator, regulatory protein PadR
MGHLSRFIEPVVLFLLARKGHSYGYDLAAELPGYAFTEAAVDRTALYRCLRQLEAHGHLASHWDLPEAGPARRIYTVTASGRKHLEEWMDVLDRLAGSMVRLVHDARELVCLQEPVEDSLSR